MVAYVCYTGEGGNRRNGIVLVIKAVVYELQKMNRSEQGHNLQRKKERNRACGHTKIQTR